jgi:type IV pilus assembly protein PilY1
VNLINYMRGQNGFEDRAANVAANRLYRTREAVLGDALESQPAFISKPVFSYPYAGYSAYKTAQAGRAGTVYMGTNDGMMHAFAASDGSERWAYVPSVVIPRMWKLASTDFSTSHANYVNGSATLRIFSVPGIVAAPLMALPAHRGAPYWWLD